uniref:ABC transporter ATP-binding protein n=1 Tax=Pararhizobium sp. IMCC3301 TaxID=3067904 RepID=UPI002742505F|nr:sn-glycerol-3-phosphate ABC transporter ATP-binding protein UgpC [Pararhizobium sp. IMCC3301]
MATLDLVNIRKSFGDVEVLHGIDAAIKDSEFVAVLGESGCGKSTLLRIIAGLESATAGQILIDGQEVGNRTPRERDIAMVFQSYALYPHMTVIENIRFPLELAKWNRRDIEEATDTAIAMLNLGAVAKRKPRELSGGQRQRVAMGRALVRQPKVFLFDEPLSNLDAKLRVQMRAEIRDLQRNLGTTSVYVTHDQIEAMTMADRVIVMNNGKVEQFGAPLELYDAPQNRFVASFIGSPSMNFLEGVVTQGSAGLEFAYQGVAMELGPADLRTGPVTLGIRPEHITVSGSNKDGLHGIVTSQENTGDRTFLVVDINGNSMGVISSLRLGVAIGETVALNLDTTKLHFFDPDTNTRL